MKAELATALFVTALFSAGLSGSVPVQSTNSISLTNIPPKISREFRAAWIASASNIDWPSQPGLPVEQQKKELLTLIERAAELRLNALIFQIRPFCDAFYRSSLEPWSYYLTGKVGKPPVPAWDPLQFAIEQAHARGLELHAWFNPYRAGLTAWKLSSNHIARKQPGLVRRYGPYLWLDPTELAVQNHTTAVILDVVKRYDIDGVHMDDYFYPYPERDPAGALIDFPDDPGWNRYRRSGGQLSRGDWRRDHVNRLVQRLKTEIQRTKSFVTFGISPFGIWRPGHPSQIKGLDAYEYLYADARHWLTNGWVDYLAPQLYWTIDRPETSFSALLDWWRQQEGKGIPIWPGGAVTRLLNPELAWPQGEILRQVELAHQTGVPGFIHWNLSALLRTPESFREGLIQKHYAEPALVPGNPGDSGDVPKPALAVKTVAGKHELTWSVPSTQLVGFWVLQTKAGGTWKTEILPARRRSFSLEAAPDLTTVALSYLSRHRNLSPVTIRTL